MVKNSRYSIVNTYKQCPYKCKLQYVDELETIFNQDADNPLIVGNLLHYAIDKGLDYAIDWYYSQYNIMTNLQINEVMKVELLYPKIINTVSELTDGAENVTHELKWQYMNWEGTADLVIDDMVIDFKYCSIGNVNKYLKSAQLHLYMYFLNKLGYEIKKLGFIFIPKINIRQKKTETIQVFRKRLTGYIEKSEVRLECVEYDEQLVLDYLTTDLISTEKTPSKLCDWCEYQSYCEKGVDYLNLPKNERREIRKIDKKVIWLYGVPFSGKTTFVDKLPDPLMLNTDGNIKLVTSPFIAIKDNVKMNGRMKEVKLAWEVFKETIEELEKKENTFKTIIVDLLEDTYSHCRIYMYKKLNIEHESDNSFKAWDMVRGEFLNTLRRLMNLDYENIVLISHEDRSKDITKKSGDKITSISPNMQDKAANVISGMVDIVGRVIADGQERYIEFKPSEVVFGGGRLNFTKTKINLDVNELEELYKNSVVKKEEKKERVLSADRK